MKKKHVLLNLLFTFCFVCYLKCQPDGINHGIEISECYVTNDGSNKMLNDYCLPESSFPWHDWIAGVKVGTLANDSEKSKYSNFSDLSTELTYSTIYPVELKTGYSYTTFDEYWKIWIDYNQDGVFDDLSEVAFQGVLMAPEDGTEKSTLMGSLSIPNITLLGKTMMRISMSRDGYPEPCMDIAYGEVEDYSVYVIGEENEEVDLEIDLLVDDNTFRIYDFVTYYLIVSNNSSLTSKKIELDFNIPVGLVESHHMAERGTYDNWTGLWKIPVINPFETITLELELFTLSDQHLITSYAQIIRSEYDDPDSTPGNGVCCVPAEDDEASVNIYYENTSNLSDLSIDMELFRITCNQPVCNTVSYSYSLWVINDGPSAAENVSVKFSDGRILHIGRIEAGDVYSNGIAWWYTIDVPNPQSPFPYPPMPIPVFAQIETSSMDDPDSSVGNDVDFIADEDDEILLSSPNNIDLSLALTVNDSHYAIYDFINYRLTVTNKGTQIAKDVIIDFQVPDGLVFANQTLTYGDSEYDEWIGKWNIPCIAPFSSVVLDLSLFALVEEEPITSYAQVESASISDVDSTPNNGSCCIANEDDEAVITIYPVSSQRNNIGINSLEAEVTIDVLSSNPAKSNVLLSIESNTKTIANLKSYNQTGILQKEIEFNLSKGRNNIAINIEEWPEGLYYFKIYLPFEDIDTTIKVIKQRH